AGEAATAAGPGTHLLAALRRVPLRPQAAVRAVSWRAVPPARRLALPQLQLPVARHPAGPAELAQPATPRPRAALARLPRGAGPHDAALPAAALQAPATGAARPAALQRRPVHRARALPRLARRPGGR